MAKAEASVRELVDMIHRGELRLPEMQRRYVWRSTQVRDLLDSLYRGYPSGAILVWDTDEPIPQQPFAISQAPSPYQGLRLLLDGQQRLTSLASVLRGEPVTVRGRQRPIELLFNLEHPERAGVFTEVTGDAAPEGDEPEGEEPEDEEREEDEAREADEVDSSRQDLQSRLNRMTFVVATRQMESLPNWVKVSEVFQTTSDTAFLKRAGVTDLEDPRVEKYGKRLADLRSIQNYVYRMDILERALTYDEVTEIFVRVNSLGAKLRGSDLALAQITARWPGSLKTFQAFQETCARNGFDLDLGLHLRNLVAFATGQSRFHTVKDLSPADLKTAWGDCVRGVEFAMNFLKSNAGIDSPALMSSPYLLVTLGLYGKVRQYNLGPDEERLLRRWARLANAKGRYSRGSSETFLDQDLATVRQGGGAAELLDRLGQQVGRLEVTPEDLAGRNQQSALFKTMFLAFRDAGACDWNSNLRIALAHEGAHHRLQFHHLFPKAVLKGRVPPREADDIANLAFVGGRTNRQISDKPPSQYLADLFKKSGSGSFQAQCIPTDAELLGVERYSDFLAARRALICRRLNDFLDTNPC